MDDFFSFLHLTTIIVTFRNHIDEFFVTMQNNDSNRVREFKVCLCSFVFGIALTIE
jgi:hypothetical protein